MKSRLCITLLALATSALCLRASVAADFTIATDGADSGTGSLSAPFQTFQRARDAVRTLKREQPERKRPIVVQARGGVYYLPEVLTFTHQDSGTPSAPIIYTAYADEEVVLSAGVPVTAWQVAPNGHWQAQLTTSATNRWLFSQLYVNGERRFRPTWPKRGYHFVAAASPVKPKALPDRFVYNRGDILPQWQHLAEKEVCIIHSWNLSRFNIKSIEEQSRTVVLSGTTWHAELNDITPRNWYRVENVLKRLMNPASGTWIAAPPPSTTSHSWARLRPIVVSWHRATRWPLRLPARLSNNSGLKI